MSLTLFFIIFGLAVIVGIYWVFFLRNREELFGVTENGGEEYQLSESIVDALLDLEYDFQTGKLDREEYERLKKEILEGQV